MTRHLTKIVATLGPATRSVERIRALIDAGVDVARINGSHGDHEIHAQTVAAVREAAADAGRAIGVLFDLQGPKIRVGKYDGPPLEVTAGDEIVFAVGRDADRNAGELPSDYGMLDRDVEVGHPLLIDDGNIATEVIAVSAGTVRVRVQNPGVIEQRKGINLPRSVVSAPALSDKDRADALFAAAHGVDLIALSFVRRADDARELRALLDEAGYDTPVVAKIEKPQALDNLDEILDVVWGVMVARGDLGVELSPEAVPAAQKRIIRAANRRGRPVITATQMLESMKHSPRPTRAEASDVANAVLDGTDAVMLSGETAVGDYPVESVAMMDRIIRTAENIPVSSPLTRAAERVVDSVEEAVAEAARQIAHDIGAKAIVALTRTGASAILISERRPQTPLLAFSPDEPTRNRLALVWGVVPHRIPSLHGVDERVRALDEMLEQEGLAVAGDQLVLCMASPRAATGATNIVMVHSVGEAMTKVLPEQ